MGVASGDGCEGVTLAVSGTLWVAVLSVLEGGGVVVTLW